jgi:hypothetical protein
MSPNPSKLAATAALMLAALSAPVAANAAQTHVPAASTATITASSPSIVDRCGACNVTLLGLS